MREKDQPKFSFHFATLEQTLKEVALLSGKKASQTSTLCQVLNTQLVSNIQILHQSSKRMIKLIRLTIDP